MKLVIILGIVLIAIAVIFFIRKSRSSAVALNNVSPEEAQQLIREKNAKGELIILDVRTPGEYASGHLKNAVNIDYHSPSFSKSIDTLKKDKTYLVYCRVGNRSAHASSMMKEKNFSKVYNLKGGIIEWSREKFPVE